MPRDGIFGALDGFLDRDNVLGGDLGIAEQPVPDVLLLDGLRHDDRQAAREFGLAAGGCYRPFDGSKFCHGSEDTQPPLCLQQRSLLGNRQRPLYGRDVDEKPPKTYGERLKAAMLYGRYPTDAALAKDLTAALIADGALEQNKEIPQQTIQSARTRITEKGSSKYNSYIARLCRVDAMWLLNGVGEMIHGVAHEKSNWPFKATIDEDRFTRLSSSEKRKIERLVLTMIEDFEADHGALKQKKRKVR